MADREYQNDDNEYAKGIIRISRYYDRLRVERLLALRENCNEKGLHIPQATQKLLFRMGASVALPKTPMILWDLNINSKIHKT